jgi:general L-amino acid transport system permease protein
MATTSSAPARSVRHCFSPHRRALTYQVLLAAVVLLTAGYFLSNAHENLLARHIASGFGFLSHQAGFEIGETTLLTYGATDTYLKALLVGLLNTFRAALPAIFFSTLVGVGLGIARLTRNWLLAKVAAAYIEIARNVPLVVQLFFWYAVITEVLPPPSNAFNPMPGIFLSNRGIALPSLVWRFPIGIEYPELAGFNFFGGISLSPEFAALFLGLTLYTASFIAEIVRAGILAVHPGQAEAGRSLGLSERQVMRFVVLPQALRLIVPPITSQYLNCTKNSSLAIAIGYPDLVAIANSTINQTGQAIEGVAIIMFVYLTISLTIAGLMNRYNARIALRGAA